MARRARRYQLFVVSVLLGLLLIPAVIGAIYVSPTAVFIDDVSKSAQVTLGNAGNTAEEVTVDLRFGFPDTDSSGAAYIRFVDDPGTSFPSSASWIRPFPRSLRLEPGSRQVVRLLAQPPADLPDGEYWARMIITARGVSVPLRGDSAVSAGVSLEVRLVTSVTYRKGHVSTGVELHALAAEAMGDSLVAWVTMDRRGNAAYLGTGTFELRTLAGETVRSWSTALAVYYTMRRRFALPLDQVLSGDYALHFTLEAERSDMADGQVLPAPTVTDSVALHVR